MHSRSTSAHQDSRRRVVVVGGGIAGAEAALTMAIGLPDTDVTLVGASYSIALLPDLVYVPFGVVPERLEVSVAELLPHGVSFVMARVERVDVERRVIDTTAGELQFDALIVAPGAMPIEGSDRSLRSFGDALRLRDELRALVASAEDGMGGTIVIRAESDDAWTAPACEMAMLIGAWIRSRQLPGRIKTMLATADHDAFEWFGPVGEATVENAMRRSRIEVATGVPAGRFDALGGDVQITFGRMRARTIDGLPGLGSSGWYEPDHDFRVAPGVHVIGDAINLPYRAGFATAWQARRVLVALGGKLSALGDTIDGIDTAAVEYQMDLADGVMRARVTCADRTLGHPFLGHDADIEVVSGARPDKLAGLLLHDRVLRWRHDVLDAPLAYRDVLRTSTGVARRDAG